ncbi:MAG: hypothetical protein H7Y86_02225 [Rhizobacter sp.]|nr:hypothetical protein [Ferruginibacter sp.]
MVSILPVMKIKFLLLLMLLVAVNCWGQDTTGIKQFYFLQGIWKGTGWTINENKKEYFSETETGSIKLSGTAIQLEAYGKAIDDSAKIINDALGIIKYNFKKQRYELNIYQADGSFVVADVKLLSPGELEWSLKISASYKVKYIIRVTGNKWYEAGYKSLDGITWQQHFEMNLMKE